jgi:putative transport protein
VLDLLAENPVLTVFLVVGLGTLFGLIPFGPLRFGAAGALFVGLALSAFDARLSEGLDLVRTIGLVLFVYTVGLAAGPTLIRTFRTQAMLMAGGAVVLLVVTVTTVAVGAGLLGLGGGLLGGVFAGVGTSTPTLAAATSAAGTDDPAVGYALTYAIGVIAGILAVHVEMGRRSTDDRDGPAAAEGLVDRTIVATRRARLVDVPSAADGAVRLSFLRHGADMEVAEDRTVVEPDDRVVVIGTEDAVDTATAWLGTPADDHLAHDRREVDYRRVLLSNPDLAGRTVAELAFPERFGGVVSRIRRGDLDLLARDDVHVQLGDRLRVVVPRGRMDEASRYLGDAERKVSEVDAVSLAFGLTLGFLLGLITCHSARCGSRSASRPVRSWPGSAARAHRADRVEPADRCQPHPAPDRPAAVPRDGRAVQRPRAGLVTRRPHRPPDRSARRAGGRRRSRPRLAAQPPLRHESGAQRRPDRRLRGQPEPARVREQQGTRRTINDGYATLFVSGQIVKVILVQVIVGLGL